METLVLQQSSLTADLSLTFTKEIENVCLLPNYSKPHKIDLIGSPCNKKNGHVLHQWGRGGADTPFTLKWGGPAPGPPLTTHADWNWAEEKLEQKHQIRWIQMPNLFCSHCPQILRLPGFLAGVKGAEETGFRILVALVWAIRFDLVPSAQTNTYSKTKVKSKITLSWLQSVGFQWVWY